MSSALLRLHARRHDISGASRWWFQCLWLLSVSNVLNIVHNATAAHLPTTVTALSKLQLQLQQQQQQPQPQPQLAPKQQHEELPETMSTGANLKTFMYFAYGSNLLSKRIHIQNPTAKRVTIGKLDGYRLDFMTQSSRWHGASATIVEDVGGSVWGAIWEIDMINSESLDRQEGVHQNIYKKLIKPIETEHGELIACRVYQQVTDPEDGLALFDIPAERQPSQTYLQTIQHGAEESVLPDEYLAFLRRIPNNGNQASASIMAGLRNETAAELKG